MTKHDAEAEAARRQAESPESKWIATRRAGEWVVASIGVKPSAVKPIGEAIQPPPQTPHAAPQSELRRVTTQYGAAG